MALGTKRGPRRPRTAAAAWCVLVAMAAAGCAGEAEPTTDPGSAAESSSPPASATPTPGGASESSQPAEPELTVIGIRVRGDEVEPRGARVEVAAGEPFVLAIDADTPGELHVHATPEATISFGAGRSRERLTLDRPGIVEVELHEPTAVTVAQLEVR